MLQHSLKGLLKFSLLTHVYYTISGLIRRVSWLKKTPDILYIYQSKQRNFFNVTNENQRFGNQGIPDFWNKNIFKFCQRKSVQADAMRLIEVNKMAYITKLVLFLCLVVLLDIVATQIKGKEIYECIELLTTI